MHNMSVLRHQLSNKQWCVCVCVCVLGGGGGGVALNHVLLLFCKSVYIYHYHAIHQLNKLNSFRAIAFELASSMAGALGI